MRNKNFIVRKIIQSTGDFLTNIPKEVVDILNAEDSIKILASVDENGTPNAVPVGSIHPISDDTLAFAEEFIVHTKHNLETTKKASVTVLKLPATAYQLKGTFVGFQTSGQLFDNFAARAQAKRMAGYNLPPTKSVGIIKVEAVFAASPGAGSKKLA
jgi:predicted pyridoxine 5'-phosphate oxidase superfamily flavin-nucleotide-binding protein